MNYISIFKKGSWEFPGGPVVKDLPSSAGDLGLTPGQGTKSSHAVEQLSLHATATEKPSHRSKDPMQQKFKKLN